MELAGGELNRVSSLLAPPQLVSHAWTEGGGVAFRGSSGHLPSSTVVAQHEWRESDNDMSHDSYVSPQLCSAELLMTNRRRHTTHLHHLDACCRVGRGVAATTAP